MATLIGVVSDTHVPYKAKALPPALLSGLEGVNLILHAGDICSKEALRELGRIAPVEAVAGNMDPPDLAARLERKRLLKVEGRLIGLVHGDGPGGDPALRAAAAFSGEPRPACIVFGHSHTPHLEMSGGVLLFNPGSPTDRRRSPQYSYGLLVVEDDGVFARTVYF